MVLWQILEKKLYLCKVLCSETGISPLKMATSLIYLTSIYVIFNFKIWREMSLI